MSFAYQGSFSELCSLQMALFDVLKGIVAPNNKKGHINRILSIVFFTAVAYLIMYLFFDSKAISIPLLLPFLVLPIVILILNHFKLFSLSATTGLLGFNIALFLVASSEATETGVYLHFVSACSVAIFLFEYRQRRKAILFICLSISLFIVVNVVPMNFIEYRQYSPENERIFFILHTLGATLISCFSFFSVLDQNYGFQKYLKRNQKLIEAQNRELLKANEELDRFVYSASHDLKAPLSSIKGLVSLMELEKTVSDSTYTSRITDRIIVMESFIKDIVQYSRNSRVEIRLEQVDLYSTTEEVLDSLSHFDHASQIKLVNNIPQNLNIKADRYRLKVILSNIITNAIKYADLDKKEPQIKISYVVSDQIGQLKIEDNGIGIEPSYLPKIFEMFFRASHKSDGSGLGLYIAAESARKMNYSITVESTIGVGTCFNISKLT